MGVQGDKLSDAFSDVCFNFLKEVDQINSFELENEVSLIATQCYEMLKSLVEIEPLLGRI
ncbi:hypothetical protein JMN32_09835 [Fulvivirga sp. 29W222]|uniref:Uncharacterized protein n=1 Tax=Fulvivirga marina TaxID=2494733 RepID=A0A937KBA1_9BACT|nr:hypothetical protein [Fulvivirga marina]MBL6446611.1 hypothetical protein [Fulvivirga marina]